MDTNMNISMNTIIIQKEKPEKQDELLNIIIPYFYKEWYDSYIKLNYTQEDLIKFYKNEKNLKTFIFFKDTIFIGAFTLAKKENKIILSDVYVVKEYRKKNIGRNLVKYAINIVSKEYSSLYLYSKEKQLNFYKKLGFFILYKQKDDIYVLKKNIYNYPLIIIISIISIILLLIFLLL